MKRVVWMADWDRGTESVVHRPVWTIRLVGAVRVYEAGREAGKSTTRIVMRAGVLPRQVTCSHDPGGLAAPVN